MRTTFHCHGNCTTQSWELHCTVMGITLHCHGYISRGEPLLRISIENFISYTQSSRACIFSIYSVVKSVLWFEHHLKLLHQDYLFNEKLRVSIDYLQIFLKSVTRQKQNFLARTFSHYVDIYYRCIISISISTMYSYQLYERTKYHI